MARICVLGIGNVLTADDGVGPHLVRRLEAAWVFPPDVELLDGGTPGLDLTLFIQGLDALIVLDAVRARGNPGELRRYDKAALLEHAPSVATTPHDPGLRAALHRVELLGGSPPEVCLIGVIPASLDGEPGLSPAVRAALPAAETAILAELGRLGVVPARREPPIAPDIWWERPAGSPRPDARR
jgi:hydrogenase maturation protease